MKIDIHNNRDFQLQCMEYLSYYVQVGYITRNQLKNMADRINRAVKTNSFRDKFTIASEIETIGPA